MKSKAEIVVETLLHYNSKNRGYNISEDHCTYLDKATGNKCAVGRCILDSEIENVAKFEEKYIYNTANSSPNVESLANRFLNLDSLLKPEYRGHDVKFWKNLQNLHDLSSMWTEDGFILSESNISFISASFGKEVADAVNIAFAEKTA